MTAKRMRRSFPRSNDCLQQIFDLVAEFFDREEIDPRHRYFVDFVLEELFTNAVRHNPAGSGKILIELEKSNRNLVLKLTDFDSKRFDPTRAEPPDTSAPLKSRRVGGLGLHLTREMADQIEYSYRDRVGTIAVTKKLNHV